MDQYSWQHIMPKDSAIKYVNNGQQCEAGMFDSSFACTSTDTSRCQVNSAIAWLCEMHHNVISIPPIAATDVV